MGKRKRSRPLSWGSLRFSVVAELLSRPPEPGELSERLEELSRRCYLHPDGKGWVRFGKSTIERWYYRARESADPVAELNRKRRSDAGESRVMSSGMLEALKMQYKDYPEWTYKLHADNLKALLKETPDLGGMCSTSTVRRRMQERGWNRRKKTRAGKTAGQVVAAERLEQREVRSYEASHAHALWHLDFHTGRLRVVDAQGNWSSPKALCVLDDHTRLVCHIQWFLHEDTRALIHGLTQAMLKRGMPRSLMTDNGSAMLAHETRNGLERLGILHERTLPYSPYQNAKQESFWGQLEGRFVAMLSRAPRMSLDELNVACQAWVEMEYNRGHHREIGMSPIQRFVEAEDVSRPAPSPQSLRLAFCDQVTRTQRRSDGTLQVDGVRFEVPNRFRHLRHLAVRYRSWDLSEVYVVDPSTGEALETLCPEDRVRNAGGCRRALSPTVGDVKEHVQDDEAVYPPLLRELIAQYSVCGLPPAVIPLKEEDESDKPQEENDAC